MNVNQVLNNALKSVPKAVAAGIVDMESGMMLRIKTSESHPQKVTNFLTSATLFLDEEENIETIYRMAREANSDGGSFDEMVVSSKNLLHFFTRLPNQEGIALALVTTKEANVGWVLVKGRALLNEVIA